MPRKKQKEENSEPLENLDSKSEESTPEEPAAKTEPENAESSTDETTISDTDSTGKNASDEDNDYTLANADVDSESDDDESAVPDGVREAESLTHKSGNLFLRKMMDSNFIEYASYVIKERAIPDVDDGLKPVQRRILWSLFRMDDGKFHKVANVIGHTMQYHPHGDASIGDALVVLANKEYYIEKQGNFGNILTGDSAAAARYIECRLSPLAKETLFNRDITEFIDSYDGRNKEPVVLPVKIPSLLMLGSDGIAVGMATKIMPHNFKELVEAQIAILRKESFEIFPDFPQGGIMDVSEYDEGNGKITIRAKIDKEGRKLVIREVPATTTTESLIMSIERAVARNKMKLAAINDYTTENVEIEVLPMRGYDPDKALKALYAYTDCSVSISTNLTVIRENHPCQMSVSEVLRRNTEKLLEYLRRELEIELAKLEDAFHDKTLAQIFIENRIYKKIEECETYDLVLKEVHKGLKKFRDLLKRDVSDDDIEKLLAIPIRRISLFDINKNRKDIDDILKRIDQVFKNLKRLTSFAIKYLKNIIEKYASSFERKTEIESFDRIDKQAVALNNIKVGWDRKNGYVGTAVRSDERVTCNEYDHLFCVERKGTFKVIAIPDKLFIGRLYYFTKYDKNQTYYIVYSDKKTGKFFAKQSKIDKFITDRVYSLCPNGCKLEIITTRPNSVYEFEVDVRAKDKRKLLFNLSVAAERSAKARGQLIASKKVLKYKFVEILDDELDIEGTEADDPTSPTSDDEPLLIDIATADQKPEKHENGPSETNASGTPPVKKKTIQDSSAGKSPKPTRQPNADKAQDKKKDTVKKTETKESNRKTKTASVKKKDDDIDDIDDLGVSQPEFGF
ncbi:MAG: DNA topoisomerase IV subunit A [Kiritimatiellaeota bacterium]|nr:DNA topoisomerase IV subunit A [Kiritimatiellota bacterium]